MLDRDMVITLLGGAPAVNAAGDAIPGSDRTDVIARIRSVGQSEFYQAQALGQKPEVKAIIWAAEYDGQQRVEIGGRAYRINRTFQDGDRMELTCQSGVV